jgi:hypothetical protein
MSKRELDVIEGALNSILSRVALVSPYYEKARDAQAALAALRQQEPPAVPVEPVGCECREALECLLEAVDFIFAMLGTNMADLEERDFMKAARAALSTPCVPPDPKLDDFLAILDERDSLRERIAELERTAAEAKAYAEFEESRIVAFCEIVGAEDLELAADKVKRLRERVAAQEEGLLREAEQPLAAIACIVADCTAADGSWLAGNWRTWMASAALTIAVRRIARLANAYEKLRAATQGTAHAPAGAGASKTGCRKCGGSGILFGTRCWTCNGGIAL